MKRSDFPSYPAGAPRPGAPDERLDAWLDGALDAPDADAVARLVATDAAWADAAEAAREIQHALASAPTCPAPDGFRARVVAEAARRAGHDRPARTHARRGLRPVWRGAVAFALLVVAVLVAVRVERPLTARPAEPAPTAAEVARAQREVAWTLAYLSRVGEKAGEGVRAEAFAPPSASTR